MPTAENPMQKFVRGLLKLIGVLMAEKAHGRLIITFRDGHLPLVTVERQYLPENLPES